MEWRTDWGLRARMVVTMFLLFALFLVFAGVLTAYVGGGVLMIAVLMVGFSLAQWFFSDRLTLLSMGADEVSENEYPEVHAAVTRLSQQADLPKPTVAVVESNNPNAFATGRSKDHAAVAVTTGLLELLTREELDGVLAHELAHVKNRDMMVMTFASLLSTLAFIVVRWGWLFGGRNRQQGSFAVAILVSLVVWVLSFVLVRALSRYREFAADRGGALITGRPSALASALMKIDGRMERTPEQDLRDQAEMNAFFIIPIRQGFIGSLFRTHPATEKRVDRLRDLEKQLETVG
jgi:heat shock protein HtpX